MYDNAAKQLPDADPSNASPALPAKTILALLTSSSAEHFNRVPEDGTWADVGTLGSYLKGCGRGSNAAFREGEDAA